MQQVSIRKQIAGALTSDSMDEGRSRYEDATCLFDTAHVWWLALADVPEDAWNLWLTVLDEEERVRAGRFFRAADRQQFIAAHGMLRAFLSYFIGGAPQDWRFITGSHGKPALHPVHRLQGIDFNISHTNGAVACAIAQGFAIGVDIENEENTGNHLDIAETYFAPAEFMLLRATPAAERKALFFRLWTLKEAYIKALGRGLSITLDRFAFSLSPIAISFSDANWDDPRCWQFDSIACTSRHRLSIALNTSRLITPRSNQVSHCGIRKLLGQ
jgi:4'-phosphopantetheinyl transferase